MRVLILFFALFPYSQSFSQSGYIFKGSGLQVTFPNKPIKDTTIITSDLKVRVVIAKDSTSNYYLNLVEKSSTDTTLSSPDKINSYFDGVIDGMKKNYKAEAYFIKDLIIHSTKVREYDMKGFSGKNPLTIKSWVWMKGNTTSVCQHMYLTQNEEALRSKQQLFFNSLIF